MSKLHRTLDQLLDEHGLEYAWHPARKAAKLVAQAWAEQENAELVAWKAEAQRMGDAALAAWTLRVHEAESELSALRERVKAYQSALKIASFDGESGTCFCASRNDEMMKRDLHDDWCIRTREALATAAQAVEPQKGE